jgi:hypothetical protein
LPGQAGVEAACHRRRAEGAALAGFGEGGIEGAGPDLIEQAQQAGGLAGQGLRRAGGDRGRGARARGACPALGPSRGQSLNSKFVQAEPPAAEDLREHAHGHEEVAAGRDPAGLFQIEPSAGDDAVEVRMVEPP